ncbi:MAG: glycoside hydrolase family 13 protein [Bacteroidales bacterium]|nr:glycoside hydrolase family 13 protein [Bacteroidales bacterium]
MRRSGTLIFLLLFVISFNSYAEKTEVKRIDPPSWWVGMNNPNLQLMVYGENIAETLPVINNTGLALKDVIRLENPNYLFLNLIILPEAKPGILEIQFKKGKKVIDTYEYPLYQRNDDPGLYQGFDNSDVIYLLMPDRFSNGNPENDEMEGLLEKPDRKNPLGRHGGDIQGIVDHLDYLEELGITALWINPLLENNMPQQSYHGYAITDYYKVDPRFGTNEDYKRLVEEAHKKGLKIIMDMVANHCGTGYYWNDDLPASDWYHEWPEFTRSNYRGIVQSDPNASGNDYNKMVKGWFDTSMPDLNQHNPYLAEFIIQNTIWWIEYLGLDGIRQDTYPYPYKDFMAEWMQRILAEYPEFNVVGEVWLNYTPLTAYWLDNKTNKDGYRSYLTNVFDFPLMYALNRAFNEEDGWDRGTLALYETIALDYLYSDPMKLVVMTDNHDGDRFYTKMQEDIRKFKLGMAFAMTVRGIPQMYYGGEILMTGKEHDGHGYIREDFPGGWEGDKVDVFSGKKLSDEQNEALGFTKRLLNWRKSNKAAQFGEFTHYIPENGVYVYFRHTDKESVMIMLNNAEEERTVDLSRFTENLKGYSTGKSVLTRTYFEKLDGITVPAKSPLIVELLK